jgi:hypothetical protein
MPNLNEIIANEEIVLIDSNVIEGYDHHSFYTDMYTAKDFSEINNGMLGDKLASVKTSLHSIMHDNVFTIKEVADELKALVEILGNKLSYISDAGINKPIWMKSKGRFEPRKKIEVRNNVRNNMIELQNVVYEAYSIARAKDIYDGNRVSIDIRCKDILLKMMKEIGSVIRLKPRKIEIYKNKQIDKSKISDTDEKLAVAVYHLSMFSGKRISFVSGDTDFVGLLCMLPQEIGSYEFTCNDDFREALTYNPFKFWLYNDEHHRFELRLDSAKISYDNLFELPGVPDFKLNKVKQNILKLWNDFYVYHHNQMHITG